MIKTLLLTAVIFFIVLSILFIGCSLKLAKETDKRKLK